MVTMGILISPHELYDTIMHSNRFTLIASQWDAGTDGGFNRFRAMHIPNAQYCDPARALAGIPGSTAGRNPLPEPDKLQIAFEQWGLRSDHQVIVYDEGRGLFAGRTWWILRWAGIKDVHILDGGLANWRAKGLPTLTGPGNIAVESDQEVNPRAEMVASIEDVRNHTGVLIDAREPSRFAGRTEALDLKAGHIPGALNIPERFLHNKDRTWKSKEEIRAVIKDAGVTEDELANAIVYSGSGNHSALLLAAVEWAGLPSTARHFVGGWSQWSANPANPVEHGSRLRLNESAV